MLRTALLAAPAALLLAGCHLVLDLDEIQAHEGSDAGRRPDSSYVRPDADEPGLEDASVGPDADVPGPDADVPGPDADVPGPDADVPGPDAGPPCVPTATSEQCSDQGDEDCDMKVNCADDDCAGQSCGPGCRCDSSQPAEIACGDSADNDGDGMVDCSDPDCGCGGQVTLQVTYVQSGASGQVLAGTTACGPPGCSVPFTDPDGDGRMKLVAVLDPPRTSVEWIGCAAIDGVNCYASPGATIEARLELLNFMFVSERQVYPSTSIMSLSDADQFCKAQAAASARLAGLATNWIAWVSGSGPGESAFARLIGTGARGWVRTDGQPFADTVTDIKAGNILHAPDVNENGVRVQAPPGPGVYTASDMYGNAADGVPPCNNSPGQQYVAGDPVASGSFWTNAGTASCSTPARVYCFQTDYTTPLVYARATGNSAFVTSGFNPASGLPVADDLCRSRANAANLPGASTFKALLATNSAAAVSRFRSTAKPWVRLDGIQVFADFNALSQGRIDAPLNVALDASGYQSMILAMPVYTGASAPATSGTLATTCGGWNDSNGFAAVGRAVYSNGKFFSSESAGCVWDPPLSHLFNIYCLQDDP